MWVVITVTTLLIQISSSVSQESGLRSSLLCPPHAVIQLVYTTTEKALVVDGGSALATVEVNKKQRSSVSSLPQKLLSLSGIVCGDALYLAGGFTGLTG